MSEQSEVVSRRLTWALVALAVAWMTLSASATWWSVVDDAYITARYAEQLASGHGVTYNGDAPPVEGVTTLSWTVLLAAARTLGLPMLGAMVTLGWACTALTLVAATLVAQALSGERGPVTALPAWLLALLPHTAVAATNGLETMGMAANVLVAVWAWCAAEGPRRWWAGAAAAALLYMRPEGLVVAALLVVGDALVHRARLADTAPMVVPVVIGQLLQTGWRLSTFGLWLPNTWYAKATFPITDTFAHNAKYFVPETWVLGPLAALLVAAVALPPYTLRRATVYVVALALALIPLSVQAWMPGLRLYQPALGVLVALLGAGVASLGAPTRRAAAAALVAGFVAMAWSSSDRARDYDGRHTLMPANGAELAARHLAAHLPAGSVVATRDAGAFAYYLGVDVHVAELHQRALTLPHPDGRDAAILAGLPRNPAAVVTTVRTKDQPDLEYPNDRRVVERLSEPYTYLGRVEQHYRRHYDVYVRSDLAVPPLPEGVTVSHAGPAIGAGADPSDAAARPADDEPAD